MKFIIIALKFMLIGALLIISNHNLSFLDSSDVNTFYMLYGSWFDSLFSQLFEVTGYVVRFDWLPGTNSSLDVSYVP